MPPRYKIFNDYESMHSNIYKLLHSKYKRNFKYAIQITLCLFISYILFINKSFLQISTVLCWLRPVHLRYYSEDIHGCRLLQFIANNVYEATQFIYRSILLMLCQQHQNQHIQHYFRWSLKITTCDSSQLQKKRANIQSVNPKREHPI